MLNYEKTFSEFIDGKEYDKASDALLLLVRAAFKAGWLAAGGKEPVYQIMDVSKKCKKNEN